MNRKLMPLVVLVVLATLCAVPGNRIAAQEANPPAAEPKAADPAKPEEPKTDEPKADPAKTDEPKADPAKTDEPKADPAKTDEPKAPSFDVVWGQWKSLLDDLRSLRTRYQAAAPADRAGLAEQWDTLIARGNELVPQVRSLGQAAYQAAPNANPELSKFLVKALRDDVENDRYEAALTLGQLLIDNNCEYDEVFNWTGAASFATHNFEKGELYLSEAANRGVLEGAGQQFRGDVKDYQQYWKQEQEIRAKEAEADDLPRVKLTTEQGVIVLELFENEAPETVGNFIHLVETGFYDGLTFHRVLPGFMAQGGCPEGTGSGGPGYEIYCETGKENARKHFRGSLSMAHAGKDTGGSQFFITFVPTASLNDRHTVFGRVLEGMDVLEKLQRRDPSSGGPLPVPDKILKAEVLRKRDHEYVPNKVK
jgi:cyclophilin family peptidyl-prolyl cis-trans isomerase